MRDSDADDVLAAMNADRLPGQPIASPHMLSEARSGRSPVDAGWWAELDPPAVDVAPDPTGRILGVVSYATRPRDGAGLILWLHGHEDPVVVGNLLDHVLTRLHDRTELHGFDFATALGIGLEALPVRRRRVTATCLRERGFVGRDLWRYMRVDLPVDLPANDAVEVTPADEGKRKLGVRDGDRLVAEATIGEPVDGIGVLWWISVEAAARGRGLGRALLGTALDVLFRLGAVEVILYVDDDEPGGDRDRRAANRLYESAGFVEVDRLHSFLLRR